MDTNLHECNAQQVQEEKWLELEKALLLGFGQMRTQRGIVSDNVLLQKSKKFQNSFSTLDSNFKLSNGWL